MNKVAVVRVFAMFCDHYRLETRFCNPYSGNEKGSVEKRGRLPAPQPHGPQAQAAESHRQLTRHLLSRCDTIADADHYRSGRPIRELFDEDRGELQPLPRARFDAVEWVERKADKEGNIQIGSVRYLAGPSWRGWTLLAGLRGGESAPTDGRHVNTLPRSYGNGGPTVRNPATLLPALARKPNAWNESPLRGELPDGLVLRLDALDPGSRRRELTLLHRASVASGFGNAVLAMAAIVEGGRAPDEASLLALARRIAQGDPPDPDDGAGRLAVYDAFNNPDGKGTES